MKGLTFLFACLLVASTCQARTITVDDDGPADFDTIQAGIDDANDGDTVIIAPATYTGDGNRDIDFREKSIMVRSTDPNDPKIVSATVIDCKNEGRGFHLEGCIHGTVSGLTVTNGLAEVGGGIYCKGSSVTISQCRIVSNRTMRESPDPDPNSGNGAGLYLCSSSAIIIRCTISDNQTTSGGSLDWEETEGGDGGGVYCNDSNVEFRHCRITGNGAGDGGMACPFTYPDGGSGGGIYSAGSTITIHNCHMSDNEAGKGGAACTGAGNGGSGGAIYCDASSVLKIRDSVMSDNSAGDGNSDMGGGWRGGNGAGLYCASTTPLELTGCTISGNMTGRGGCSSYSDDSGDGGGIWCRSAVIENCSILGNNTADGVSGEGGAGRAGHGAGIYCTYSLVLTDSIISENRTGDGLGGIDTPGRPGKGGGVYCLGPATITRCRITANRTGIGGGTDYYSTNGGDGAGLYCASATIAHCEILNNTTGNGGSGFEIAAGGGSGAGAYISSATITNCLIAGNTTGDGGDADVQAGGSSGSGGGLFCNSGLVSGCIITANATGRGGSSWEGAVGPRGKGAGTCCTDDVEIIDSIIWDNQADQIFGHDCNNVTFCDISDDVCIGSMGNISAYPCFVEPGYWADADDPNIAVEPNDPNAVWIMGDYHLSQKAAGQAVNSPCVDAGSDTAVNLGMDQFTTRTDKVPDEGIVDMGYHYCENIADLNNDGKVDMVDLAVLASQWRQEPGIPSTDVAPVGSDGMVDGLDLALLAENWLWNCANHGPRADGK